jgi:hypothetical protein
MIEIEFATKLHFFMELASRVEWQKRNGSVAILINTASL